MPRPRTPLLSLDKIADGALELVARTGDVQMVALAKHLGVAPSSLYGHVRGRDEVIDLARLRMLESITPLPSDLGWRDAVDGLLRQLVLNYSRHLRLLPLIFATTVSHEKTIGIYEPVFTSLLAGGFRPDQLRLIIAHIEFQAMGNAQGLPDPVVSDEIRSRLPAYAASVDHSAYDRSASVDFSSRMILFGLEAILRNGPTRPID